MKTVVRSLLPILLLCLSLPARAAFVQSAIGGQAGSATTVTTSAITVTAGDKIAIGIISNGTQTYTPSDSKGDTFVSPDGVKNIGSGYSQAWYVDSAVGGSTTFTVNYTTADQVTVIVEEFSGRASGVYAHNYASYASLTTSHSAGSVSACAGCDVFAYNADNTSAGGTKTYTAGSGWTISGNENNGNDFPTSFAQYQANVSAGTVTNTSTSSNSTQFMGFVFAFSPAGGSGPPHSQFFFDSSIRGPHLVHPAANDSDYRQAA